MHDVAAMVARGGELVRVRRRPDEGRKTRTKYRNVTCPSLSVDGQSGRSYAQAVHKMLNTEAREALLERQRR